MLVRHLTIMSPLEIGFVALETLKGNSKMTMAWVTDVALGMELGSLGDLLNLDDEGERLELTIGRHIDIWWINRELVLKHM